MYFPILFSCQAAWNYTHNVKYCHNNKDGRFDDGQSTGGVTLNVAGRIGVDNQRQMVRIGVDSHGEIGRIDILGEREMGGMNIDIRQYVWGRLLGVWII